MTATFAPFGLRPVAGHGTHGNEVRAYQTVNGAACPELSTGAPVKLTGGVIVSATGGAGPFLGSVQGVAWIDPVTKRPIQQGFLPAATSSAGLWNGDNRPEVLVADNPNIIFMIQANASVSAGDIGLNFNVTATAADANDSVFGVSRHALQASTRTSAIGAAVKLVGLARIPDNVWSDAFPVVLVRLNSIIAQVSAT